MITFSFFTMSMGVIFSGLCTNWRNYWLAQILVCAFHVVWVLLREAVYTQRRPAHKPLDCISLGRRVRLSSCTLLNQVSESEYPGQCLPTLSVGNEGRIVRVTEDDLIAVRFRAPFGVTVLCTTDMIEGIKDDESA